MEFYIVIESDKLEVMSELVGEYLKKGYMPAGGLCTRVQDEVIVYAQAVYKP